MASQPETSPDLTPDADQTDSKSSWTYPTRTCRLCLEDVPATVTLYPPGLPVAFQRPMVEYKNDDEYGRLMKPCHCRGGMRYIHELCLRRSRTENQRPGSLWKCHECGYQFNFHRLTVQKYLGSKTSSGILTILVMALIMFLLGFVADPILNLYTDPYETIVGHEDFWQEVNVNQSKDSLSNWAQHFLKGFVSMGVLSFLRTMVLNPFQWWNLRNSGLVTSRVSGRSATGRDRAVNISWIVVAMGVLSAAYFFYQFVQTIIGRSLQRIGNNIVDTQLPGDDDDLKPPPGFKVAESYPDLANSQDSAPGTDDAGKVHVEEVSSSKPSPSAPIQPRNSNPGLAGHDPSGRRSSQEAGHSERDASRNSMPGTWDSAGYSSALDGVHTQGWSFRGL